MTAIRIEATIETDGELHLRQLPCRKGDRVAAILIVPSGKEYSRVQQEAYERYLVLANEARFRSNAPYPARDELHTGVRQSYDG